VSPKHPHAFRELDDALGLTALARHDVRAAGVFVDAEVIGHHAARDELRRPGGIETGHVPDSAHR
jgi:hypothetical protein